jgi:hypothetical protein
MFRSDAVIFILMPLMSEYEVAVKTGVIGPRALCFEPYIQPPPPAKDNPQISSMKAYSCELI